MSWNINLSQDMDPSSPSIIDDFSSVFEGVSLRGRVSAVP
jgi:hypothetical protein